MRGRSKGMAVGMGVGMAMLSAAMAREAAAQCTFDWRPGEPIPGVDGTVSAMINWDPDGAGPQPKLLVVAGGFRVAGDVVALKIAAWDGESWHALGAGLHQNYTQYGGVLALAVHDGDLIVGGWFTHAGDVPARNIARWDGEVWHAIGEGFDHYVTSLAVYEEHLIAGGVFDHSGSTTVNCIAQWTGESWESLAGGMPETCPTCLSHVDALEVYQGDLIAGGVFLQAGAVPASCLARWDGSSWHQFGGGAPSAVFALLTDGVGLYAGGALSLRSAGSQ